MKDLGEELSGGCCVCADPHGYEENPLVYCDGAGCSVAVHQGCYGILSVPEESWFCAKCAPPSPSPNATCLLCRNSSGALKRTSDGGWAHVICALYIPEVAFGDVHSMEPVITADIPAERFSQTCSLCSSSHGACMQCNRFGCPSYFHVTCAQRHGLLCEEGGDAKNVKYCGYCQPHYDDVADDPAIKFIPAFPFTRKNGGGARSHLNNGRSNPGASATATQAPGQPLPNNNHSNSNSCLPPPPAPTSNPPAAIDQLRNCVETVTVTPLSNGPSTSTSSSAPSPQPNSQQLSSSLGGNSSSLRPHPLPPQSLPSKVEPNASKPPPPPRTKQTPAKRGRPPGSTNASRAPADGEEKPKRPRKTQKKTVKSLLESVSSVVEDTVSSFQAERVASQQQMEAQAQQQTAAALLGLQQGTPQPQPPPPPQSLPPQPQAQQAQAQVPQAPPPSQPPAELLFQAGALPPPSQASASGSGDPSSSGVFASPPSTSSTLPNALEELLERQWEQGSAFLTDQAAHFDIASLLSCLQQLKSENAKLEKEISSLSSRKEHLLAVNARLALSYSPRAETETSPIRGLSSPASQASSSMKAPAPALVSPNRAGGPAQASPVLNAPPPSAPTAFLPPPSSVARATPSIPAFASLPAEHQLLLLQQQQQQLAAFLPSSLLPSSIASSSLPQAQSLSLSQGQPPQPPSNSKPS